MEEISIRPVYEMDGGFKKEEGYVTETACGDVRVVSRFTAVSSEPFDVLTLGPRTSRGEGSVQSAECRDCEPTACCSDSLQHHHCLTRMAD